MPEVLGRDIKLKPLDIAGWHRYRAYFLGRSSTYIGERDYLYSATQPEAVRLLFNLMSDEELDINEDNCVEIYYDIICYVDPKSYQMNILTSSGQEQYKQYKELRKW